MRLIVLLVAVLLALTGVPLALFAPETLGPTVHRAASLVHIWGGVFFLVVFALYAWDHISENRHWLRVAALVTFTGGAQTMAATLIILTGIVLLLYGNAAWTALRQAHHWLTYPLAASIALHFMSRK